MTKLNISVVIPTCDRPELIRTALRSVVEQTFQPLEIIVVDNGQSPVKPESLPGAPLVVRTTPLVGVSKARNIGVKKSIGEYVAFLDDDDTWSKDYLEKMFMATINSSTRPDLLIGRRDKMVDGQQQAYKCVSNVDSLMPALFYSNPGVGGQNLVVFKNAFLEVGGFYEALSTAEDRALVLDFLLAYKHIICVPDAVAIKGGQASERLTGGRKSVLGKKVFIQKYKHLMDTRSWLMAQTRLAKLEARQNTISLYRVLYYKALSKMVRWIPGIFKK